MNKLKIMEQTIQAFKQYKLHSTYNLCSRFFSKKENKNLTSSIRIMEMIFANYLLDSNQALPFNKSKFNELNGTTNRIPNPLASDVLKILRCNKLIKLNKRNYSINNEHFYTDVRYRIRNKIVLKDVTHIMISFIRTSVEYAPKNFFQELDKLFAHVLKLPISHNVQASIEHQIYETINNAGTIDVIINNSVITITPKSIDINGAFKEVIYEDMDANKDISIPLKNISLLTDSKKTPSTKKVKVVLASHTTLYNYFQNVDIFNPNTTKIKEFKTQHQKLFNSNNSSIPSANFFIVEAEETIEDIVHLVQCNLQYIKVLSPNSVKEAVRESIELYLKNDGIDTTTIM